jgi:hypothetical protein
MKKVRDWLSAKPQFEVLERYPSGNIREVIRIKDGKKFHLGLQESPENARVKIYEFLEDCIHVRLVYVTIEKRDKVLCAINTIVTSEGMIIGWTGISESNENTARNYSD